MTVEDPSTALPKTGSSAQDDKRLVLATVNFVRASSVNNGQRRYYTRVRFLHWEPVRYARNCSDCQRRIEAGQVCAWSISIAYCRDCVALMSEEEASLQAGQAECPAVDAARLRGQGFDTEPESTSPTQPPMGKYGLTSGREMRHVVHKSTVAKA